VKQINRGIVIHNLIVKAQVALGVIILQQQLEEVAQVIVIHLLLLVLIILALQKTTGIVIRKVIALEWVEFGVHINNLLEEHQCIQQAIVIMLVLLVRITLAARTM